MLKLNTIDFISTFFSEQYNKKASEYFEKWHTINTTKILSISPLVNAVYIDKCYSKVRLFIKGIIDKINQIREKIVDDNELIKVKYFTAPPLNNEKKSKQSALFSAIKLINPNKFEVINGQYLNKTINCMATCKKQFQLI